MSYLQGPFSKTTSLRMVLSLLGMWLMCAVPYLASAQDDLNIHGVVSDAMTSSKLDGVTVKVLKDGAQHDVFTTRANGKYEFYLDCNAKYDLVFSKPGFVERSIQIDARNIPKEVIGAGIIMPTDMSMYEITEAMKDADLSVFQKPIGKAAYNPSEGDLVWDFNYTNQVKSDITTFMRNIEKKQKELDKQASDAEKAAAALEEKFNKFVKDGDAALSKNSYQDAVLNYKAALEIKPDELAVKQKLGDAETKWNAQKLAAEKEASYAAALDAGDGFMRTEEFSKAIEKYEEALAIKPGEKYPTDQIALANKTIKERKENMARQEQFNALMAEAETSFKDKSFEPALAKYQEAQKIFPDNKEVERKIEGTKQAIANKAEMEKIQAEYDALIASADASFEEKKYKEALAGYQAAAGKLPNETYPPERIAASEAKIAEQAAMAEKQANFDALMQEGQTAMTAQDYAGAVEKFGSALEIMPSDANADKKYKEAKGLLAEKNAAAEKQAQYDKALAEADALYKQDALEEAKSKYQHAHNLIPEEKYPMDQITSIDAKLKENAKAEAAQQAYDDAMAAGVTAEDEKRYAEAVKQYQAALDVYPNDKNAQSALERANALKAEFEKNQQRNEEYNALIADADSKFTNENFEEARTLYESALKVKPDESYPTAQLDLIKTAIENREKEAEAAARAAEMQAQYEKFMKAGNEAFNSSQYEVAIAQYNEALAVKADDPTATSKRDEAQTALQKLQSQQEIDANYQSKISEADALFNEDQLSEARKAYVEASGIKSTEKYPKERISAIDEKIAAQKAAAEEAELQAKTDQVNALVLAGDNLVKEKNFAEGIEKYEEALSILPDRADVQSKIEQANAALLAYQEAQGVEEAYNAAIENADKAFKKSDWAGAKSGYTEATGIKSDEQYPKDRLKEVEIKIAEAEAAAEAERQKAARDQFDALMKEGDKNFRKQNYEDALASFESALDVLPGNEEATARIDEVNELLGKIDARAERQREYQALISEGDALFDSESYEMARLKFLDAQELMPEEKYPPKKITEIDIQLEKQRLAAEKADTEALNKQYNDALSRADDAFRNEAYDVAVAAYNEALGYKPEEAYPKSQIGKIELLRKEKAAEEAAEKERIAAAQNAPKKAPPRHNYEPTSNVNTNSEEQAEQFMRDAREAQEQEKYLRIQSEKQHYADNNEKYREAADERRSENRDHLESFEAGAASRHSESVAARDEKVQNSVAFKTALLQNRQARAETADVQRNDSYEEIRKSETRRTEMILNMEQMHEKQIRKEVDLKEAQLEQMRDWSERSARERLKISEKYQDEKGAIYSENKVANELRMDRAAAYSKRKNEILENRAERSTEELQKLREAGKQFSEQQQNYLKNYSARSNDKIQNASRQLNQQQEQYQSVMEGAREMADKRRDENLSKLEDIQQNEPKDYNEYFRSQLAENYPQGVSEESSTLGNKVIIKRIVVRGNKGDEYKKVLDKAGNYYFKNGQSISENTWNRETIEAFNKSKD